MRVELQDVAILAGARLTFIGITYQVLLPWELAGHEAPLQPGREPGATATTQSGLFDCGNHLIRCHSLASIDTQNLPKRLIPPSRFIIFQAPVAAIQAVKNLGADVTPMEGRFKPRRPKPPQDLLGIHALPSAARRPSTS